MKKVFSGLILLAISFVAFSQYQLKNGYLGLKSRDLKKASITYKNLRLYPLIAGEQFLSAHKNLGNYTSLKEALASDKVEIEEVGTQNNSNVGQRGNPSGEVNKLMIENNSRDTVFLMAGEVIQGGKQDRVLAQDMVLPPNSGQVDISVFCVEQGRWAYGGNGKKGFKSYYSVAANSVRKKAAKEKNQRAVWMEVEEVVIDHEAQSGTGTYTELKNSGKYNEKLKEYGAYFMEQFSGIDNCIGFVAVSGDEIIGCDLFATPGLFKKQLEHLLDAYIGEALKQKNDISLKDADVVAYLEAFLKDEKTQDQKIDEMGVQYKLKGKKLHINMY